MQICCYIYLCIITYYEETVLINPIMRALVKLYILQYRKVYDTMSYKHFICFSSVYVLWVERNGLWLCRRYILHGIYYYWSLSFVTHILLALLNLLFTLFWFSLLFFFVIWYVFIITVFIPEGSRCKFLFCSMLLLFYFVCSFSSLGSGRCVV